MIRWTARWKHSNTDKEAAAVLGKRVLCSRVDSCGKQKSYLVIVLDEVVSLTASGDHDSTQVRQHHLIMFNQDGLVNRAHILGGSCTLC